MDTLSLHIGPEALLMMMKFQRQKAVVLWERGFGIRIWNDDGTIRYELGNGERGIL